MPQYLTEIHHPNNYDPSVEGEAIFFEAEAMQRELPSTQMSNQLTRRDFAIRTAGFGLAGFGLAMGLAPAATLAEAEQASRSETSPAVADPYSLVDPELLPVLKQFPRPLTSQRRWSASSGNCPACPRYLLPRRSPWSGISPGRQEHPRFVCGSLILRRWRRASRCCFTCMAAAS